MWINFHKFLTPSSPFVDHIIHFRCMQQNLTVDQSRIFKRCNTARVRIFQVIQVVFYHENNFSTIKGPLAFMTEACRGQKGHNRNFFLHFSPFSAIVSHLSKRLASSCTTLQASSYANNNKIIPPYCRQVCKYHHSYNVWSRWLG